MNPQLSPRIQTNNHNNFFQKQLLSMFSLIEPRPPAAAPVNLPNVRTPGGHEEPTRRPSPSLTHQQNQNRNTPPPTNRIEGFHSSLLTALREDTDEDDDDLVFNASKLGMVASPTKAWADECDSDDTFGADMGGNAGGDESDSPTSPLGAPRASSRAATDIRVLLANGNSKPVEVLRNQVVTSLTLKLKPDWMSGARGGKTLMESLGGGLVTRKLLLPASSASASSLSEIDELKELEPDATEDEVEEECSSPAYRELMMRLRDMQYICVKAAAGVDDDGVVDEREYWLPLDKHQTVADLKKFMVQADALEHGGSKLLQAPETEMNDLSLIVADDGRTLEDDGATVVEEGITDNTTLHLMVRKDANITVKMRGTKDLEVKLHANETTESLRAKLEAMRPSGEGAVKSPLPSQLFYGGRELKDGPLNMYGVADGATLELRPHASRGVGIPMRRPSRHSWNAATNSAWKPGGLSPLGSNGQPANNSVPRNIPGRRNSMGYTGVSAGSSVDSAWDSPAGSNDSPTAFGSPDLSRSFDLARQGLAMGNRPQLASSGTGGAYFLRDQEGQTCAVFKPVDEEPLARNNPRGRNVAPASGEGLRKGTRVGEGASREVAAYVLDHDGFAGVPATSFANLGEQFHGEDGEDLSALHGKLGSFQAYVHGATEAEEMGPHKFPVHEVHKITQLDIRLANTDRNAGNILVQKSEDGDMKLVPIDHGYALPHTLEDVCFEWEFWPQAKLPYSEEIREYIADIDVDADIDLLREQGIELQPSSERVLRVCTTLLQRAAAIGCCPADIAGMMSRPMPNRMSDLEKLVSRAASSASAAVRADDGLTVHRPKGTGWADLDQDDRVEDRFMVEYTKLLDSYLEGFEPEVEL